VTGEHHNNTTTSLRDASQARGTCFVGRLFASLARWGPDQSVIFGRKIAKWQLCLKFVAKILIFLKKNSPNFDPFWGRACRHKSVY